MYLNTYGANTIHFQQKAEDSECSIRKYERFQYIKTNTTLSQSKIDPNVKTIYQSLIFIPQLHLKIENAAVFFYKSLTCIIEQFVAATARSKQWKTAVTNACDI